MKYTLKIIADTNDGDYVHSLNTITKAELDELKPVVAAIKAFKPYKSKSERGTDWKHENNFPYGDCCREDLGEKSVNELYENVADSLDLFMNYMPCGEHGIHTIVSVEVAPEVNWTKLL